MLRRLAPWSCLLLVLAGCKDAGKTSPPRPTVRIFAAASTRTVIEQLGADFQAAADIPVLCESAASSTLARQIAHGDDADLFLSADEEWADCLAKKGLAAKIQPLLTNRLVVVVPVDSSIAVKDLADLAGSSVKRLSIAGESVPAGRYARQALRQAGVRQQVDGRLLEGKDVTAVLLYVARGEADAGFVYATDAAANGKVRVVYDVPEELTGPIRYPLVTVRRERANPDAGRFAEFLAGDAAAAAFRKAGFGLAR